MTVVLQVNFTPSPDRSKRRDEARLEQARQIAELPGLQWKIWIEDVESSTRGGIYLFDDLASAKAWAEDSLRKRLTQGGATNISIRYFEVDRDVSVVTRAPLEVREPA
jgi:hypothetical protein